MNFEIISVGTELLLGQIVNTNAREISRMLSEFGYPVYYTTVVGDNPERLREALAIAAKRAEGIITTGGLGPTKDDLTKETIMDFFGKKPVLHGESLRRLNAFFAGRGRPMPENNLKQAMLPEGCFVLDNDYGTAPGAILETEKNTVIMLPGPPRELKPMLQNRVRPYLKERAEAAIISRSFRVFGMGESAVDELLAEEMQQKNPTLAPYAKTGEVELRLTARARTAEEAALMLEKPAEKLYQKLGDCLYAEGEDETLQSTVVRLLGKRGMTVSTAESCTGGLVAKKLTEVSGASACFHCGAVTYSNDQKERMLGVPHQTLAAHGAVSPEVALAMSRGAKETSGADIGVGITGIAGPGGGSEEKPVGLVYVSVCGCSRHAVKKLHLRGDREAVRERASLHALDMIRRCVLGLEIS